MKRLYDTAEQRAIILEWVKSEKTCAEMAARYAISATIIHRIRRDVDGEFFATMKSRVWLAIQKWKRGRSEQPEEIDLPGMPPTRRSILLDMIRKELDAAGDDKLERFFKAIITA